MDSQSSNSARNIALLYRQKESIVPLRNNSPKELHIAVPLGLPNFVREIIDRDPELALSFDEHGLTSCHLAVANGQILVIKELLHSKVGVDICGLKDKAGFLPIHIAVVKGNVDVLKVVNDTCHMRMLRESTQQGDSILHLALKFDSLKAFHYLWHFLSRDKKVFNSRDEEGNTLLHVAVSRRQQEIVKMLVDKVDLNAINLNGSTALDIFLDLGYEHRDMTIEKIIRRAGGRRAIRHDASQPLFSSQHGWLHSEESRTQPASSSKAYIDILFHLQGKLFDFRRTLSRQAPNYSDRETSNTLMIIATLISTIIFQSALNPPGGFIQSEEDRGMAVLELYLGWYLLYDIIAFLTSLSVILLVIYGVPKWKDLIKVAMFITWISVFFTFLSFHYGILFIFDNVIHHPLIVASLSIGYGIVLVFAFFRFIYSWCFLYKIMFTFLPAGSTKGIAGKSKIVVATCLAFLGAALVWLPIIVLDISSYCNFYLGYLSVAI